MSIIYRLAGNNEYNQPTVKGSYVGDVEKHFAPYKEHPVVKYVSKLPVRCGFNKPMALAVHLTDAFTLKERVSFKPIPPGLKNSWGSIGIGNARKIIEKSHSFVEETRFKEFIETHQDLYEQTENRMRELIRKDGRLEWFDNFFGPRPNATFNLIIGMLNGGCNYHADFDKGDTKEMYCFLGVWLYDQDGLPRFDKSVLTTVVHEFAHSYVNPLVGVYYKDLQKAGKKLFPRVKDQMKRQAYNDWSFMISESIVGVCEVCYIIETQGPDVAKMHIEK
ncbi:unnamed protein product, partial [marine sediment metagenome]